LRFIALPVWRAPQAFTRDKEAGIAGDTKPSSATPRFLGNDNQEDVGRDTMIVRADTGLAVAWQHMCRPPGAKLLGQCQRIIDARRRNLRQ
jgi:hypothetical protein